MKDHVASTLVEGEREGTHRAPTRRPTQADAWDGWLDDADAVVFAGTSFSVQVTREALRRCGIAGSRSTILM